MSSLPPPTLPPPEPPAPPPQGPQGSSRPRRTPWLLGAAVVVVLAVAAIVIVAVTRDGDGGADPTPTEPTATTAPTDQEFDLEQVAENIRLQAVVDPEECPLSEEVFAAIRAAGDGTLVSEVLDGDVLDLGSATGDDGMATLQCTMGTMESAAIVLVGALGDEDAAAWLDGQLGYDVALTEAATYEAAPAYTFEETNPAGHLVGAMWSKERVAAALVVGSIDQEVALEPEDASTALTGSLDTLLAELAAIEPPAPRDSTAPASTLPSQQRIDTTDALAGVERVTSAGEDEPIVCPFRPETMASFPEHVDSEFFANAFEDRPIFGASVWLRDEASGAFGFRCSTTGMTGLVGMYAGDVGDLGLDAWLAAMGGPYELEELGENRGGTVHAVEQTSDLGKAVGSMWTDGRLVLMVLAVDDPALIDVAGADTAAGLLTVLEGMVADLAAA